MLIKENKDVYNLQEVKELGINIKWHNFIPSCIILCGIINGIISTIVSPRQWGNSPLYQKEAESISHTRLNLLKAVVKGETQFTSTAVMQKHALGTPRNVSKNKTILINSDVIHEVNGVFEFIDPAFELWFKKQYFNQNYIIV